MELLSCTAHLSRVSHLCNRKSVSWFKKMFYVVEVMFAWCTPSNVLYLLNLCLKEKVKIKIDINKNDLFHDVSTSSVSAPPHPTESVHRFDPDWDITIIGGNYIFVRSWFPEDQSYWLLSITSMKFSFFNFSYLNNGLSLNLTQMTMFHNGDDDPLIFHQLQYFGIWPNKQHTKLGQWKWKRLHLLLISMYCSYVTVTMLPWLSV